MSNKENFLPEDENEFEDSFIGSTPIIIDEEEAQSIFESDEWAVPKRRRSDKNIYLESDEEEEIKESSPQIEDHILDSFSLEDDIEEQQESIDFVEGEDFEKSILAKKNFADTSDEFIEDITEQKDEKKEPPQKQEKYEKEREENVETKTKVKEKKKKSIFAIFLNIIAVIIFLFVIFETVIAFLNFNLVKQKKEPTYFVTTKKENKNDFEYTIYDMGLFKIVRKENAKEYEIKLLPFFLNI